MAAPTIDIFVDITISVSDALAARTSFGTPLGAFDHSVTANRVDGPYSSIDEVTAAGFTSGAEPEVFGWASAQFDQGDNGGVDQVKIGRQDVGDADWTATLDAIEAEDDEWYGLNIESRAEADILLAAAWIETREKIFIAQSSDAALLAGTAGNVGEDLQAQSYSRTALIYHAIDDSVGGADPSDGYLDGAWMGRCLGFNLDGPNGVGRWSYKRLVGIPFDTFTTPQITNLQNVNANWYGSTKELAFPFEGTMASGRFIDVTTSVDWTKNRLEEEILTAFVDDPVGLGYDTAGIGKLERATGTVIGNGLAFGHYSQDFDQVINWPTATSVGQADRTTRVINATGALVLKGGIHRVILSLNVSP